MAALNDDAGSRDIADLDRVVLGGTYGVGEVESDLLGIDIKGRDKLDIAHVVRAELHMHEPGYEPCRIGILGVLDPLNQR